jgi:hypothetical protein
MDRMLNENDRRGFCSVRRRERRTADTRHALLCSEAKHVTKNRVHWPEPQTAAMVVVPQIRVGCSALADRPTRQPSSDIPRIWLAVMAAAVSKLPGL